MTGAELRAIREAHGWAQRQVSRAWHYAAHICWQWERDQTAIPPAVAAWAAALPPVPASGSYPPTRGGLRAWMRHHGMLCSELAAFCGVSEHSVCRWLLGTTSLPPGVTAWLRAGAPPLWEWAPRAFEAGAPNMLARAGKPVGAAVRPTSRPRRTTRRLGSWALRRARVAVGVGA